MGCCSAIKKNELMLFAATWTDHETVILSEVNQTKEEKYHDILYVWNLNINYTNELTNRLMDLENLRLSGGIVKEFGMLMYALLYLKWITNKDLLHSTWNSAQCYAAAWMGPEFGGECMFSCSIISICSPMDCM